MRLIGSFLCIYLSIWLPLASFGCLWNAFGAPWVDFGLRFDSLGSPWALSGRPLGAFGSLWPALGPPLALFGQPLGHIGNFIENWTSFTEKCVKFTKLSSKYGFCVFARFARLSHGSRRSGGMKCCSDPPSTRAGGQDDVSFTNSLKLGVNEDPIGANKEI